jgi:hypothetical protein
LTVEGLDANWSENVGPYAPAQVAPSGFFDPIVITVQPGSDVQQDVLMLASAIAQTDRTTGSSYANPVNLPQGGGWGAWLSGYGVADWLQFTAQGNRTASVSVTSLDEAGQPTQNKAAPVIGIWPLSDQSGGPAPAATPSAFNTLVAGVTRLDAEFTTDGTFRLGVADSRGDGRPDYFYMANVLYSDSITPARIGLQGGPATMHGLGFHPGLQVSAGAANGALLWFSANDLQTRLPPGIQDGVAPITINDPSTGGFSQMTDALTYGAAATDLLVLLQGSEPSTANRSGSRQSHSRARGCRGRDDSGCRSHCCVVRHKRREPFYLRRSIVLLRTQRRSRHRIHTGDARRDRHELHHSGPGPSIVFTAAIEACKRSRDRIADGPGRDLAHQVGRPGRNH